MKTLTYPLALRNLHAVAVLVVACLLMANSTFANTVTTLADSGPGSLRNAIANSANNGTINFQAGLTGTIVLTSGELEISQNLTIIGPGATSLTVSGNQSSRILNITSSTASVGISGLTIAYGLAAGAAGTGESDPQADGSDGQGGGIFNSGTLTLTGCKIYDNWATGGDGAPTGAGYAGFGYAGFGYGGGIFNSGTLMLSNCWVDLNVALGGSTGAGGDGIGGGICSTGGALALSNCTISQNLAQGGSGGELENGDGAGFGGGISSSADYGDTTGTSIRLVNCTITRNIAQAPLETSSQQPPGSIGGGVYTQFPLTLICCTISENTCASSDDMDNEIIFGGGIGWNPPSPTVQNYPTLANTIVAENVVAGPSATNPDVGAYVNSMGFNFIGEDDGSLGWISTDIIGTTGAPRNPQLAPMAFNGGPTPTMALLPGSPAIDQGFSKHLTTDQRDSPRPFNYLNQPLPPGGDGSDIGAFELAPTRPNLAILVNLGSLNLTWLENQSSVNPMAGQPPRFGVQTAPWLSGGMGSTPWKTFALPVRMIGGMYIARDSMIPGSAFYRLSTAVTNILIPPAVTTPATAISSSGATLNGTTTPYGFNTAYWFQYGPDTNYGTFTATNNLATSTNLASLGYAINGLNSSTVYHFQLVVTDNDGTQYGGDQSFTTQSSIPPPEVATYAATAISSNSATLNGSVNGNGQNDAAYFQYGTDTTYASNTYNNQFFGTGVSQDYSTTVSNLAPLTTYHYRAFGTTIYGQSYGADQTFTTAAGPSQPPPTVSTLAASSVTTSAAVLNGSVNPNGGNTTAYFEYGTTTSYGTLTSQTAIGTTPESDFQASLSGLSSFTTYHYRMDAVNSGGTSYSADATFTTAWVPVPPTLISPGVATAGGAPFVSSLTPTFTWSGASQASSLDLVIAAYPSGTVVFTAGGLRSTNPSFTLPSGFLTPGNEYQWHMVDFNSLGNESSASGSLYFEAPSAPTVQTLGATNVQGNTAVMLNGNVNPNGASTMVYFEYGTSTNYGTSTTQTIIGATAEIFSATISGLPGDNTFHYRIDASNSFGTGHGADAIFVAP